MKYYLLAIILVIGCKTGLPQQLETLITEDTTYTYSDADFELLDAAANGDTSKIKAFLEMGTNVNTTTYDGVTPLMYASQGGYLRAVEILIDAGANVNAKPYNMIDALLGATIAGHTFVVDTLILNGAHVDTRNMDGVTPLMYAAAFGYDTIADLLIFYGANVNGKDNYGNEPIHFSSFYDHLEITDLLLQHGADVNAKEINGFTPLMIAAQNGYYDLIAYLLDQGADINATNNDNAGALALAIIKKHFYIAELLINRGANATRHINEKTDLYDLARIKGDRYIRQLLLAYGTKTKKGLLLNHFILDFETDWNNRDLLIGGQMGLMESKSKVQAVVGYLTRPAVRSVLIEDSPNVYYQYWESRSYFHLGLDKFVELRQTGYSSKLGGFAGLHGAYTYGNYRGSAKKPDDTFLLVPKAGFYFDLGAFRIKAGYEYMNIKNSKASPHRVNISVGFKILTVSNPVKTKKEPEL